MKSLSECLAYCEKMKRVDMNLITRLGYDSKSCPALMDSAETYHAILHYLKNAPVDSQPSGN